MPIKRFTTGPRILVEFGNRILDDVERGTVKPGTGVRVKQTSAGQILDVIQSGGGAAADLTPFQIFVAKHLSGGPPPVWDGTYDVSLNIGVLNGFLASNIFDTINLSISSMQFVVLSCVADAGAVTSYTWSVIDPGSFPSPVEATADAPPGSFSVLLGVILFVTNPNVVQIVSTNLSANPIVWTVVQRPSPLPYGLAYQNFYTWSVASA